LEKKDNELQSEIKNKLEDAEKLDNIAGDLPESGETTPDQNKKIDDTVTDLVKNLIGDPDIDLDSITPEMLREKGLDPATIDEIMKLKDIHDKVKDGKPIDAAELKGDLDGISKDLQKDAHDKQEDRENLAAPDKTDHLLHEADKIARSSRNLPDVGKTDPEQNYNVDHDVVNSIKDIVGDPN